VNKLCLKIAELGGQEYPSTDAKPGRLESYSALEPRATKIYHRFADY
jgi:hypothetical protein